MSRPFIILYSLLVIQYSPPANGQPSFRFTPQVTPTTASLRGLSVVSEQVAWASGSAGTVLRTTDGGATWTKRSVPQADSLDFRSLQALSAEEAFVLSAGAPALLYHTIDGGTTWQLRYENRRPGIFFDALAFWDTTHGIAMSDPVNGQFVTHRYARWRTNLAAVAHRQPASSGSRGSRVRGQQRRLGHPGKTVRLASHRRSKGAGVSI